MSFNLVTFGAVSRMADMEVARQKKIGAATCQLLHCHACSANQGTLVMTFRKIKWMMSDHNFYGPRVRGAKPFTHPGNLLFVNAAAFNRQRARRIYAEYGNFFVVVKRPQISGYVAPIFTQWSDKTCEDVMQRHIMVAGYDNLWFRQAIEKNAGLLELM